jgi:hypothetical protein
MAAATEQLTKVEDQILETLTSLQKPVVDALGRLAEKAESYVPEVGKIESLPTIDEFITTQFAFIEKLVANQKEFVDSVLNAIKPVTDKVAAEAKSVRPAAQAA